MLLSQIKALKNTKLINIIFAIITILVSFFLAIQIIKLGIRILPMDSDTSGVICVTLGKIFDIGFYIICLEIALICLTVLKLIQWFIQDYIKKRKDINTAQQELEKEKIIKEIEDKKYKVTDKRGIIFWLVVIIIFLVGNCTLVMFMFKNEVVYMEDKIITYSVLNRKGATINYSNVEKYTVSDDGNNNAVITLELKNSSKYTVGGDVQTSANTIYEDRDFAELVKLDEVLRSYSITKVVDCTSDDFRYYDEQKKELDILMKK